MDHSLLTKYQLLFIINFVFNNFIMSFDNDSLTSLQTRYLVPRIKWMQRIFVGGLTLWMEAQHLGNSPKPGTMFAEIKRGSFFSFFLGGGEEFIYLGRKIAPCLLSSSFLMNEGQQIIYSLTRYQILFIINSVFNYLIIDNT